MSDILKRFNELSGQDAETLLLTLCGSSRWANALAARRPFTDAEHLQHAAGNLWFYLDEADWLEAFAQHPRIGEHVAAAEPASFQAHSGAEQAGVLLSLNGSAAALTQGNQAYEQRFGFLYIVCASGRTAPELLAVLEQRLQNDRRTELHEAARQQGMITALRISRWLQP